MAKGESEHARLIYVARLNVHMKTDYTHAPGCIALGIKNPRPVVNGHEFMVQGECGTCISREEALMEIWFPLPDEIEKRKAEAIAKFGERRERRSGGSHHGLPTLDRNDGNIRVYPVPAGWREF